MICSFGGSLDTTRKSSFGCFFVARSVSFICQMAAILS
ncbi:hypothetical protein CAter10_4970 [Collimonas arenae]|nr:hypothetical protein CAter10_4970 [Collimonas arenae]